MENNKKRDNLGHGVAFKDLVSTLKEAIGEIYDLKPENISLKVLTADDIDDKEVDNVIRKNISSETKADSENKPKTALEGITEILHPIFERFNAVTENLTKMVEEAKKETEPDENGCYTFRLSPDKDDEGANCVTIELEERTEPRDVDGCRQAPKKAEPRKEKEEPRKTECIGLKPNWTASSLKQQQTDKYFRERFDGNVFQAKVQSFLEYKIGVLKDYRAITDDPFEDEAGIEFSVTEKELNDNNIYTGLFDSDGMKAEVFKSHFRNAVGEFAEFHGFSGSEITIGDAEHKVWVLLFF